MDGRHAGVVHIKDSLLRRALGELVHAEVIPPVGEVTANTNTHMEKLRHRGEIVSFQRPEVSSDETKRQDKMQLSTQCRAISVI